MPLTKYTTAVKAMEAASKASVRVVETQAKLIIQHTEELNDILTRIDEENIKLANLSAEGAEKRRVANLDVDLAIRGDKEAAFKKLAGELKMAVVESDMYKRITDNVDALEKRLATEAEQLTAELTKKFNASKAIAIRQAEQESMLTIAKQDSKIESLESKVKFLEEQLERQETIVQDALQTAKEIGSAQAVTINQGK